MFNEIEIEEAYHNLRNYFYYEKFDLATREKIFKWPIENVNKLCKELNQGKLPEKYSKRISLNFYPKKFKQKPSSKEENYYSNYQLNRPSELSNLMIFIDVPVEIHIISVLWIKLIGRDLDSELGEWCYGNRLLSYTNQNKKLFKRYLGEYKKWWKGALDTSKSILDNKKNATIFTFDIKSYYHSIEYDFDNIKIQGTGETLKRKRLIQASLVDIHKKYKKLLVSTNHQNVGTDENLFPLPIGLLSSFVLANDYLKEFDDEMKVSQPEFYGRYVDDIIIVYKSLNKVRSRKNRIKAFIKKNFDDQFDTESIEIQFKHDKYKNLKLQNEKVFLYELSHKNSPSIINVLLEEQKQRSSEFRFLSDINDENFTDFDSVVFERSFDFDDGNKAKFKEPNEDKFKIASFIAKLTQKIIEFGPDYKKNEIQKIYKFFKGQYYIKHYYFWEKILTLFWVSKNYKLFYKTIDEIKASIDKVHTSENWNIDDKALRQDLNDYLHYAAKLAVNLNPIDNNETYIDKGICTREHFSRFPFLQYTVAYKRNNINLLSTKSLEELKENPELLEINIESIPTGKTFYWCYIYYFFLQTFKDQICTKSQDEFLLEVLKIYNKINLSLIHPRDIWNIEQIDDLSNSNRKALQLTIPSRNISKNNYRASLINQDVKKENFIDSLLGKPNFDEYRAKSLRHKLDECASVNELDIVVKPELAIPYASLLHQVAHSSRNDYSLNSGIEFISSKTTAYNFIITTLPCRIDQTFRDCLPVIRIKNKYTYKEELLVTNNNLLIPKIDHKVFFLYRWKGLYFSNYYCFELTSIEDRSIFKSMIDLIIAPIWNMDGHYFKSIANSMVRDIHCYYLQSNTSEYDDSRIAQPTKSNFIKKASAKGGTINEIKHNFNLVLSDLEVEKLRHFQSLSYIETQEKVFKKHNILKPLPPDWNYDNVKKRIMNKSILDNITVNDDLDDLPF